MSELDDLDEIANQMDKKRNPGSGKPRAKRRKTIKVSSRTEHMFAAASRWSNTRRPITLPTLSFVKQDGATDPLQYNFTAKEYVAKNILQEPKDGKEEE